MVSCWACTPWAGCLRNESTPHAVNVPVSAGLGSKYPGRKREPSDCSTPGEGVRFRPFLLDKAVFLQQSRTYSEDLKLVRSRI
jgi:hypothetical protein